MAEYEELSAAVPGRTAAGLTLLGGGVFGNRQEWITEAIERAVTVVEGSGLDIAIVSYGRSQPAVKALVDRMSLSLGAQ